MTRADGHERLSNAWVVLAVTTVLIAVAYLLVWTGPDPGLVAIFHGSVFALMLLALPLAGSLRPRGRAIALSGMGVAFLYLFLTNVAFLSVDLVPQLPTERWIAGLGERLATEPSAGPAMREDRVPHWSATAIGDWGVYHRPGEQSVLLSPRRVAFQRLGHDLTSIAIGLVGAALVALLVVERPSLYDSEMLPADRGRGSPEVLRHLIERGRNTGRGGQAPSTRA